MNQKKKITILITIPCEECGGTRYKPEILDVKYKEKNISDILNMEVSDALKLFQNDEKISTILGILDKIGMGYITLGQPAPTLSGGEAQRIKLARELGKIKKGADLFILDEPTTGLHFHDIKKLIDLLEELVEQGNSVIIIEHDLDILSYCDWIIELGPGGGPDGGKIIAEGTPEDIQKNSKSNTGRFLKISD
ncbi:MAG: ATP-binding cassette domain-containing protein [Candidatus Helarchaeota archaeon]